MRYSLSFKVFAQLICLAAAVVFLYPLVLMLVRSFAVSGLTNYLKVFETVHLLPNFMTSAIIVSGTLLIVTFATSMAAFAFSKLRFKGKDLVYYVLLSGMMIPTAALIFPLFQIVKLFHINNTPLALIFPYATANALFNLLILKNYIDTLPDELLEAAIIDGAGNGQMYRGIVLPLCIPGLAFVLTQTFLNSWNELQMALVFINDPAVQPISVVPLRFIQTAGVAGFPLEVMYASLVICLAPIVLFYILTQRFFLQGLTQGAIKG